MKPIRNFRSLVSLIAVVGLVPMAAQSQQPRNGGELVFPVPSEPPSYDGHREETFGLTHPIAPFYNTLLRVDPNDKGGTKRSGSIAASGQSPAGRPNLHADKAVKFTPAPS